MNVTFPEHLAQLMKHEGINNAELARRIGVSHVSVGNYLAGRVPKYDVAQRIAEVFGIAPDYLLNPGKYKRPFDLAKEAAALCEGDEKEKNEVFNRVVSLEGSKLKAWQEGFEEAEGVFKEDPSVLGGINWRDRALIAETKLANLRIKLGEMLKEL